MLLEQFSNLGEKEEKHCSASSGCSKSTYPEVLLKQLYANNRLHSDVYGSIHYKDGYLHPDSLPSSTLSDGRSREWVHAVM